MGYLNAVSGLCHNINFKVNLLDGTDQLIAPITQDGTIVLETLPGQIKLVPDFTLPVGQNLEFLKVIIEDEMAERTTNEYTDLTTMTTYDVNSDVEIKLHVKTNLCEGLFTLHLLKEKDTHTPSTPTVSSKVKYLDTEDLNDITEEGTYVQMYKGKSTKEKNYPKKGICRLTVDVLGARRVQTLTYKDGQVYSRIFRPNGTITEWTTSYKKMVGWKVPNEGTINQPPQYYLDEFGATSKVEEAKRNVEMGITGSAEWGWLTTRVNHLTPEGNHIQEYRGNTTGRLLIRTSVNATTWGAWKESQFAPMV